MRKADEEAEIISDWKFAAMVVDRSYIFYYFFDCGRAFVGVRLASCLK